MKTVVLAASRYSLIFTAVAALSVQPAQAFTITMNEVGSNVVANGRGAFNLTGLTLHSGSFGAPALIRALTGNIFMATGSGLDGYLGFTGPTSFGSGDVFNPNTFSGDAVGIDPEGFRVIVVPNGYTSGTALSDSMTFNNATFASLGLTPGTYVWTWGDGANQRFTLRIGAVPDGGSTVSLLGCALFGLAALRRKLGC